MRSERFSAVNETVYRYVRKVYQKLLLYSLQSPTVVSESEIGLEFACDLASASLVIDLFRGDPRRAKAYQEFLRRGYIGVVIHAGGEFAAACWMSTPDGDGPSHLPRSVRRLRAWHLFGAHTRTEFRGRGLYRRAMESLIVEARRRDSEAWVLGDTLVDAYTPRRTLLRLGFVPCGIVHVFRIPRLGYFGTWIRDAPHAPILF